MELAPVLFLGGLVIFAWIYVWVRQREQPIQALQTSMATAADDASSDAVLVATESGQLLFVNDQTRRWLGMETGDPTLEFIARQSQPSETFLELFAREAQASFQLGGRWVEATSYTVPGEVGERRRVVTMRELGEKSSGNRPDSLDLSTAIALINEISDTLNASLGVEQVLQSLLTLVRRTLPADAGEITLWDETTKQLQPRGWVGDVAYVLSLAEEGGSYKEGEGITGWIARYRKPVLVSDVRGAAAVQPKLSVSMYSSYIGVPLEIGDRFIGTFELASFEPGHYTQRDLALLQAISQQAATAIYNAELYANQTRRIDEIANIQQLAKDVSSPEEASEMYGGLSERIARLLTADMAGVLVFDDQRKALIAEPPFHGLPLALVQGFNIPIAANTPAHEIFYERDYWMSNDLADEPLAEDLRLTTLINAAGMYNTILMPMEIGNRRIGMLQVSNKRSHGGFTPTDVQNLRILGAQAAVVVENIRLFQTEQRVDSELEGLQEITQAIGAISHADQFYSDITARIARLMDIAICGVLRFDEANQRLSSQLPFYGAEDALVSGYAIELKPGTSFAEIWKNEDYWYSNRVSTDPIIFESGLVETLTGMGVVKTMFAVLSAGGRRVGMLQVANKTNGENFNEKDGRLLMIFATQAAAMIENARLYSEMQGRADEAESIRRVAELAGGILTAQDSFTPMLAEIGRLLDSPIVHINLIAAETGQLVTDPRYVYGGTEDIFTQTFVHDLYSKNFENSVALSKRPFFSNDLMNDPRLLPSYREVSEKAKLFSAVMVPLVIGDRSLGEMGVANRKRPYSKEDRRLLQAAAIQVSSALERVRLQEVTGQNLSRRLQELDAISRVSNELNTTLEFERVLEVIMREAQQATGATGVTVAILSPRTEWRLSTDPDVRQRMGDAMPSLHLAPIEYEALTKGTESALVDDYALSPLAAAPAQARSALAAAVLYAEETVGIIHLFHDTPNHFDQQASTFLLTLSAKASLGYANAMRYQESLERSTRLRRRVEQLNQIFELGQMLQNNLDTVMMLEAIAYSVQQSAGFDMVLMTIVDPQDNLLRRVAQAGMPVDAFEKSRQQNMKLENALKLMKEEYKLSESFFLPLDKVGQWYVEGAELLSIAFDGKRSLRPRTRDDWREGDMLLVPMYGTGGDLIGVMSLDRPFDNRRPDRASIEILEIFAHQAASNIESTRLFQTIRHNAEQEARLNEVLEAITSTLNVNEIVETVARGALRMLPFMHMTVALADADNTGFELLNLQVQADESMVITTDRRAALDDTAMGHVFESGQDELYYAGTPPAEPFTDLADWQAHGEQTTLVLPLVTGGTVLGAMHIGSDLRSAFGFDEYRPLFKRIANLTAIAIQNARLFNQAVNLRLFNESVVESIQQGIVVLDRNERIISVNEYMQLSFGWDETALQRNLFAYRPSLNFLADDLRQVMETGEPREILKQRIPVGSFTFTYSFYMYPLLTADNTRGAVLLFDDVTERSQLEENIEARANQLSVLSEVSSRVTATLDYNQVMTLALDEMVRVLPYDTMSVWERTGEQMVLRGGRGFERPKGTFGVPANGHERIAQVVQSQRPYSVSRLEGRDPLPGEDNAQSWLGVPLLKQGYVVGVLALSSVTQRFYDIQSEQAAFAFANQVSAALTNAQLYQDAVRSADRMSLLNRVSTALAHSLDNENILEIGLREIAEMIRSPQARAYVIDRDTKSARVVVEYPRGDFPPMGMIDLRERQSLQYLNRTGQPLVIEDVTQLDREDALYAELTERGITAYLGVPMTVAGNTTGIFEIDFHDEAHAFETEQIDLAMIISSQAAIAVQNAGLLEQTMVRSRELETLLEAAQATSFTLDLDEVFQSVSRLTLQALDMDDCVILLYYPLDNSLEVQIDLNRYGARETTLIPGTRLPLKPYPSRQNALVHKQVVVIRRSDPKSDPIEVAELEAQGANERMLVPLVVRDQAMGMMIIQVQPDFRPITHRDIRMAQALCAQAATAIENARLSTETAARVEELLIINELSRAISSTVDIPSMIKVVREQIPELTKAQRLYLALFDPATNEISFPMAMKDGKDVLEPPRKMGDDEVSYVLRHKRLLSLGGDFSLQEMRRNLKIETGEDDLYAYLGVPLISGDQVVGVLAVMSSDDERAFGLNDQRILTTIAAQLGAAIQNGRLFDQISNFAADLNRRVEERTIELQEERDRIDVLYRITSELARTLDIDRVLNSALEMVVRAVKADDGLVLLITPDSEPERLFNRASYLQLGDASGWNENHSHPAELLGNWLMEQKTAQVLVNDLHVQSYWPSDAPGADQWRSAIGVRLETNQDIQGALVFLSRDPNHFDDSAMRLAVAAASQIATAINNTDLYNLIRDQADRLSIMLQAEQEEAEKSTAILESIGDGVVLTNAEGNVVSFNSAAEVVLDMPRETIIGQPFAQIIHRFGEASQDVLQRLNSVEAGSEAGELDRLELGARIINVQFSPVTSNDQLLGTVSVFRDITREVEVDRMKTDFIMNVSHELRTPLTSLKGFSDLMLMGAAGPLSESQQGFAQTIKQNAVRLESLVNDLLNISKLDSGDEVLRLGPVAVGEVVDDVLKTLSGRAAYQKKNLDVHVNIDPGLPFVRGDRDKVRQIVTNIIDNAFNYTYAGGSIDIAAYPRSDRPHILLTIKDSGIGIPLEFQSRVWGRFERYDQNALTMDVAGTGLGLPIAKTLVEMHGGEIWLESEEGTGTTFFISLPMQSDTSATQTMNVAKDGQASD